MMGSVDTGLPPCSMRVPKTSTKVPSVTHVADAVFGIGEALGESSLMITDCARPA